MYKEKYKSLIKNFRETLTKIIGDKGEDSMTKFGAIIAQGILDAAGRNAALTLATRNGHVDTASVVGILIFLQYWFWFPLTHFLSLAMRPTCLIALNSDLKMPKVEFRSNAKPSLFAYPAPLQEKKEKAAEKVETAILSITAKQLKKDKERQSRGSIAAGGEKMDVDETSKAKTDQGTAAATAAEKSTTKPPSTSTAAGAGGVVAQPTAAEPEATFEMLNNPARVLTQQLKYMTWTNKRFEPLKNVNVGGIIILNDKEADSPLDFVDLAI
uniref:26S proteasome regulatory subunit RPN2 C-terminal domain-containing protein n=1 Tax=Romanomermis culicivorax TaxID=13658 RepID=A0A915J588_ROMCU